MNKPQDFSQQRSYGPKPKYDLVRAYQPPNNKFVIISGSCSVESEVQLYETAVKVAQAGATHLRGGVFRAGTYPKINSHFGWIERKTIQFFHKTAHSLGLKNIIEVLDYSEHQLDFISDNCDVFQVGARAMQNYSLLRILGSYNKPVFLKRNVGATVDEWLGAAEHLLISGVKELYLIERGSSTFHNDVRWTPCLHVIPSVKSICKIPVIVDASHATGRRDLVESITYAGVAAGAGGVLIEVHQSPEHSLSDAEQAVDIKLLPKIIGNINHLNEVINDMYFK